MSQPIALFVTADTDGAVYLNGHLVGYGPMRLERKLDQNTDAVIGALAGLIRDRLGWPEAEGEPAP